jgi:hypothetical protein
MKAHWHNCLPLFAVTVLFIHSATATAQGTNLALHKPLVDQSSEWNNTDQYNGSHITDGLVCESDQNEGGTNVSSFWLCRESGSTKLPPETVTIDLQTPTMITEIHLRNTHNAQFNDRNTFNFQIDAGNDVCVGGEGITQRTLLMNPVTILIGQLSDVDAINCPDEIPPDIFDSTSGLTTGGVAFRYIQFIAIDSYHSAANMGNMNNRGLNELEVYGSQ